MGFHIINIFHTGLKINLPFIPPFDHRYLKIHFKPFTNHILFNLVGGLNPSEKYESQLGLLFPIYGKIMFQTTKQ
jgi:hypothetical protein